MSTKKTAEKQALHVAFCHPDLGLGGAERLVVDAACELAAFGHTVDVYTAHHDRSRCFKETLDGPFSVTVCGDWFPRSILKGMHAFCAYIRCVLIAIHIAFTAFRSKRMYDVVFVDQVSAAIPVLLLLTRSKVLFYCHFPDQLLARHRKGIYSWYRAALNTFEELSTGQAHQILVNSRFTQDVFYQTFGRLRRRGIIPEIFHPAVLVPSDGALQEAAVGWEAELDADMVHFLKSRRHIFLSINRFERKKNLGLAVRAFRLMLDGDEALAAQCALVIAGGYDKRLAENREHYCEIQELVKQLGVETHVRLLASFTDAQRTALLAAASVIVYTPANEHFGIVPLEAMASGCPVIACNSGGPTESIIDGKTGYLCDPDPAAFSAAMAKFTTDVDASKSLGRQARLHVQQNFSREAFGAKLNDIVQMLAKL